jgi:hypothetical protein
MRKESFGDFNRFNGLTDHFKTVETVRVSACSAPA